MRIKQFLTPFIFLLLAAGLLVSSYWLRNSYLVLSFGVVFLTIVFFIFRFEGRKVEPKELVLLAVLAAIAAVGRIPFASIPSVQPTTFVIMMAGFVFGAESGFMIGAVAALASNMIMGQGPWTPWQMVAWGLVGLTAGFMKNTRFMHAKIGRLAFGVVWGFLFGWIMNIWGFLAIIQSGNPFKLSAFWVYLASSGLFDMMHAISNVVFLLLFGDIWIKILTRFKRKYGLLE